MTWHLTSARAETGRVGQGQQWLTTVGRGTVALVITFIALLNLVAVLGGAAWEQPLLLDQVLNLQDWGWGTDGVIFGGVLLLVIAGAVARGKRQAWWLSLGVLSVSLLSVLSERPRWGEVLIPLALLVMTLVFAPLFATRSSVVSLWRGYGALIVGVGSIASGGVVTQVLTNAQWATIPQRMILLGLRGVAFASLSYGVVAVLRPVLAARHQQREERGRVRAITERYGQTTMAYFALRPENSYVWSASGASFIAYRVIQSVALAVGDPIGPPEEQGEVVAAFTRYCRQQDWLMAIYQASTALAETCRAHGWHLDPIGADALVDLGSFAVAGKVGAPIRHAIARAQRDGVTAQCWQGETLPPAIFAEMHDLSTQWLAAQGAQRQMGFSMGRFPADWSPDLLTVVALDTTGHVQAFLTWTPLYAAHGWSLDCMRRAAAATPGVMELVIATALTWAKTQGAMHMSLGLAPLAGVNEAVACDATGAASHTVVERGAIFLQKRGLLVGRDDSLARFKAKFQPTWQRRYLLTRQRTTLPRIGLALAAAHGRDWHQLVGEALHGQRQPRTARPSAPDAAMR